MNNNKKETKLYLTSKFKSYKTLAKTICREWLYTNINKYLQVIKLLK